MTTTQVQVSGKIEWTTRTTTTTIRQNAKCKCGVKLSRLLTVTVKRTERSDMIGTVGRPQIDRRLSDGTREQSISCACGRHLFFQDVKGTFNSERECNEKCMGSVGHVCECSCGGKNHGAAHAA